MTRGLVSITRSASALNLPRAAAPAVPRPTPSLHVRTAGGRAGASSLRVIPAAEPYAGIRLTEVLGALSYALDLTEGQPMGHSVRTTMIGMRIGEQLGLSDDQRSALFYTLLLKDLGCSSNASRLSNLFGADDRILKKAHKLIDWTDTRAAGAVAPESCRARAVAGSQGQGDWPGNDCHPLRTWC
jgi:hypothetical protein